MLKRYFESIKDEKGQALTEYGLILALIAVVCIAALTLTGTSVSGVLNNIAAQV
ncbi:MAG: Flp family type IVb pilin [Deltaproteobacteria bacterium]|nr:Flp family type IVb pilin [Deltaproteobacteria bacterium]